MTVQENNKLDSLQWGVSKELNKIYPIVPQLLVRKNENGKEFLAVIVRGSSNRLDVITAAARTVGHLVKNGHGGKLADADADGLEGFETIVQ